MSAHEDPRTPRASGEMNVTPFLDILLVLLVTFMVLVRQTVLDATVALPQPCAGVCAGDAGIVLEVGANGVYRVNTRAVARAELGRLLTEIYAGRPEKIIQLLGLPGARYQDVVEAIDVARGAGVRVIGLADRTLAAR